MGELYILTTNEVRNHLISRGSNQFKQCISCSCLHSCIINQEVSIIQRKVSRALRQAVNAPIQGSLKVIGVEALCMPLKMSMVTSTKPFIVGLLRNLKLVIK